MSANLLAQHVALIRDYVTTVPTPAPPAPAPPPAPVAPPVPPAFVVLAVPAIDLTISTAISPAKSLAAITTAETAVLAQANVSIPGCTVNVVGSPVTGITLTGTPTTAGLYRLVLTYVRNDGSGLILGSSLHDITVIDPAVLFVAGSNANYTGRAGVPVNVTLCSPTLALNANVLGFPDVTVPGCVASLTWTQGGTSSGTFRLVGTPTTPGTYNMTVSYFNGARLIGTSVHIITITAAWNPAPPPPPPAPAPPAPAPAPAPSPAPVPSPPPRPGADPFFALVKMLHSFNAAQEIGAVQNHVGSATLTVNGTVATIDTDTTAGRPETGARILAVAEVRPRPFRGSTYYWDSRSTRVLNVITNDGSFSFEGGLPQATIFYSLVETLGYTSIVGPALYGTSTLDPGAEGEAAGFLGGPGLQAGVGLELDASQSNQTAECYVRVNEPTGLWDSGAGHRYTPVLSLIDNDNALVWTLGLFSTILAGVRVVRPMLWRATSGNTANAPLACFAASVGAAPGGFVHLAGQWDSATGKTGCWWGGAGGSAAAVLDSGATGLPLKTPAALRVGGSCPAPVIPGLVGAVAIHPLHGAVDQLRITPASRNTFTGVVTDAISAINRNIPWPTY